MTKARNSKQLRDERVGWSICSCPKGSQREGDSLTFTLTQPLPSKGLCSRSLISGPLLEQLPILFQKSLLKERRDN